MDDNKSKALAAALSQIEKQFGKGSIMRLGDDDIGRDIDPSLAPYIGAEQCGELLYRTYRVVINHQPTMLITEKFPYRFYSK